MLLNPDLPELTQARVNALRGTQNEPKTVEQAAPSEPAPDAQESAHADRLQPE